MMAKACDVCCYVRSSGKYGFQVYLWSAGEEARCMQHPPSFNSLLHIQTQRVLITRLGRAQLLPGNEIIQTLTTLDSSSELKTPKKMLGIHGRSMGI